MPNSSKIKLLDNYQLFQLIKSDAIDSETRQQLKTEYNARNLPKEEKTRLRKKYQLTYSKLGSKIEKNNWSLIMTAFALNKHFRHLAMLKTHGRKKEAENYMI